MREYKFIKCKFVPLCCMFVPRSKSACTVVDDIVVALYDYHDNVNVQFVESWYYSVQQMHSPYKCCTNVVLVNVVLASCPFVLEFQTFPEKRNVPVTCTIHMQRFRFVYN